MRACASSVAATPRAHARWSRASRVARPARSGRTAANVSDDAPTAATGESVSGAARDVGGSASTSDFSSRPYRTAAEYAAEGDAFVARHFVNLKNGIEAVPALRDDLGVDFDFVRIQSTMCEAGDMEKVIGELDANFLLAAALGYSCVVYDYGSRDKKRGAPRALWYGLEFVRYALNVEWFGAADRVPVLRGKNVSRDFSKKIRSFSKSAKKKLRYYRKFLTDDVKKHGCVRLVGVYKLTEHDDDETFYATLLRSACAPEASTDALNEERDDDENVFDGGLKKKEEKTRLVSEGACVRALEALGFEAFYGGDADEEWVAQVGGKQT
jgi:hypothetical protein